jgi:hypothetical protein
LQLLTLFYTTVLNKSEIIKRTLDYLQVALGFYVKEVMMRTMTPEEAQSALEVRKDRVCAFKT